MVKENIRMWLLSQFGGQDVTSFYCTCKFIEFGRWGQGLYTATQSEKVKGLAQGQRHLKYSPNVIIVTIFINF